MYFKKIEIKIEPLKAQEIRISGIGFNLNLNSKKNKPINTKVFECLSMDHIFKNFGSLKILYNENFYSVGIKDLQNENYTYFNGVDYCFEFEIFTLTELSESFDVEFTLFDLINNRSKVFNKSQAVEFDKQKSQKISFNLLPHYQSGIYEFLVNIKPESGKKVNFTPLIKEISIGNLLDIKILNLEISKLAENTVGVHFLFSEFSTNVSKIFIDKIQVMQGDVLSDLQIFRSTEKAYNAEIYPDIIVKNSDCLHVYTFDSKNINLKKNFKFLFNFKFDVNSREFYYQEESEFFKAYADLIYAGNVWNIDKNLDLYDFFSSPILVQIENIFFDSKSNE